MSKSNQLSHYAIIKTYNSLAVPVELLPQILKESYIVETSYDSGAGKSFITKVKTLESVELFEASEIESVLATQRLCND